MRSSQDKVGIKLLYIEDVELGGEIGPLETVATDERVAAFCLVWGQSKASRFTDDEAAKSVGLPGPIVPGIMSMAMMTRLLTDWAGPDRLKDLDLVFRQPVPHNKPLKISATVTDTRQENGENLVECDIMLTGAQGERHVGGKAILALPNRA
jgi:acyl dehydratase